MIHMKGTICSEIIAGKLIHFFVINENDVIQSHHLNGIFYEREELEIIARFFPRGGIYIDIGANVGNHIVYVCKFLYPTQVVPFEPNPQAVDILKLNLILNNLQRVADVSYLGIGLSDTKGRARVRLLHHNNLGGARMEVTDDQRGVLLAAGDDYLTGRKVDFVKIDVEGMEMEVLEGLSQTVAKWRPFIFVEVEQGNDVDFNKWLEMNGYSVATEYRRYSSLLNYMIVPVERRPDTLDRQRYL